MAQTDSRINKLTLAQKAALCAGRTAWQTVGYTDPYVPSVLMTDGPHGLRKQVDQTGPAALSAPAVPATCFPAAATTACSFDPDLVEEMGRALGSEARDQKVQLVLGPGINIKRSPLCGRNFEYFSEDPLLSGKMGAALIRGIQSQRTGACVKHFAANSREYFRMVTNSIMDDRALFEIYLAGFEYAIRESSPYAVMSAYNLLNGSYCGESRELVEDVLREIWGFSGIVISDWGAVDVRTRGIDAGMDLEMPYTGPCHKDQIVDAVRSGLLSENNLDECVSRLLTFADKCEEDSKTPYTCDYDKNHDVARKAAQESAVLLVNDGTLPLRAGAKIALIGEFAVKPRYQGSGSSEIVPRNLEKPIDEFPKAGFICEYAQGYDLSEKSADENALIREAVAAAQRNEAAVVFAGLPLDWEYEGQDREHMLLPPAQLRLIEEVAKAAPTIVLLCCGAPVELPFASRVNALLHLYLGGEAGASAAAALVRGTVTPSGKLAESYPFSLDDTPAVHFFHNDLHNMEYRESVYVGYRFYDAANKDVQFPFGFGLSYTTFTLDGIHVEKDADEHVCVLAHVTNTGECEGAEVVQVYQQGASRPYKQLAGFAKVKLKAGESKKVRIQLEDRALSFYDHGTWKKENCDILIGTSSRDIQYTESIKFSDAAVPTAYAVSADCTWPEAAWRALFKKVPPLLTVHRPFTLDATLTDLRTAACGRFISKTIHRYGGKFFEQDTNTAVGRVMMRYINESPFRALVALSGGDFSYGLADALLKIANGSWLSGIGQLWKELRNGRRAQAAKGTQEPLRVPEEP